MSDEREYEIRMMTVSPSQLQVGDYSIEWGRVSEKPRVGTKWVTFKAQITGIRGLVIHEVKLAKDQDIEVQRKFETEASKRNREREYRNECIQRWVEKWPATSTSLEHALASFTEKALDWGSVQYNYLSTLLAADARRRVEGGAVAYISSHVAQENFDGDYLDALNGYVESITKQLVSCAYGTHSTSAEANLLNEVYSAELARFIDITQHSLR